MKIAVVFRGWRGYNGLTVRDAAQEIGIDKSTLSRLERGEKINGETMATVLRWLLAGTI